MSTLAPIAAQPEHGTLYQALSDYPVIGPCKQGRYRVFSRHENKAITDPLPIAQAVTESLLRSRRGIESGLTTHLNQANVSRS